MQNYVQNSVLQFKKEFLSNTIDILHFKNSLEKGNYLNKTKQKNQENHKF